MTHTIFNVKHLVERVRSWIDGKPRTGWYLTALLGLNYVIDLLQSLL